MSTDESTTYESLLRDNNIETAGKLSQPGRLNEAVIEALKRYLQPKDFQVKESIGYGASFWTRSLRVVVTVPGEDDRILFLKLSSTDEAKTMMEGEFYSQQQLHGYVPSFIPEPIACGKHAGGDKTYWFLSEFVDMLDDIIPEPTAFCARVAELHTKSMQHRQSARSNTSSLTGKFGVERPLCQGNIPLREGMYDTWEEYFSQAMMEMMEKEQELRGTSMELQHYEDPLLNEVIPSLLGPLKIEPCLVHGDLWHGNTSVSARNGEPYAFDSCAVWAHNENEMGIWRAARYRFKREYVREYHRHIPISEPEEHWNARNKLYAVRIDLLCSALYPSNSRFRELAVEGVRELVEQFAPGYPRFMSSVQTPLSVESSSGAQMTN